MTMKKPSPAEESVSPFLSSSRTARVVKAPGVHSMGLDFLFKRSIIRVPVKGDNILG